MWVREGGKTVQFLPVLMRWCQSYVSDKYHHFRQTPACSLFISQSVARRSWDPCQSQWAKSTSPPKLNFIHKCKKYQRTFWIPSSACLCVWSKQYDGQLLLAGFGVPRLPSLLTWVFPSWKRKLTGWLWSALQQNKTRKEKSFWTDKMSVTACSTKHFLCWHHWTFAHVRWSEPVHTEVFCYASCPPPKKKTCKWSDPLLTQVIFLWTCQSQEILLPERICEEKHVVKIALEKSTFVH